MSATPLRQGDVVAKKFEIEAQIGTGPTGVTYSARPLGGGKKVSIKVLHGPSIGMERASAVAARIMAANADALVPLLEIGEHNGQLWVAAEYFEAESLRRLMDSYAGEKKSFSLQEACQIAVRVLEAVESAHAAGLVHRHIKPANVMVSTKAVGPGAGKTVRTIKLNGLGYSELMHERSLDENLSERPVDRRYLAPELASLSAGGTIQTDIFSVGIMLYELLVGQTPMGTYLSPTQIRDDLPKHVDGIVDIAISTNPEDRYPSARDMINDIQRAFTEDDKPTAGISGKRLGLVLGGSVVVLGLVGALFAMNDPVDEARRADQSLRAEVIRDNPVDAKQQEAKAVGHPNMAWVPAGTYISGRMHSESEKVALATEPRSEVKKTDAYYIDLFEWPNEMGSNPDIRVSASEAESLCQSVGKRLCTASEWERACKGPEQNVYGYGNTYNPEACGIGPGGDRNRDGKLDRASGSSEACKSGWGVYDMSGGAFEWTSTVGRTNPNFRMLKGGKQGQPEGGTRCAYGTDTNGASANAAIGFRCCLNDGLELPPPGATPANPAVPSAGEAPAGDAPAAPVEGTPPG